MPGSWGSPNLQGCSVHGGTGGPSSWGICKSLEITSSPRAPQLPKRSPNPWGSSAPCGVSSTQGLPSSCGFPKSLELLSCLRHPQIPVDPQIPGGAQLPRGSEASRGSPALQAAPSSPGNPQIPGEPQLSGESPAPQEVPRPHSPVGSGGIRQLCSLHWLSLFFCHFCVCCCNKRLEKCREPLPPAPWGRAGVGGGAWGGLRTNSLIKGRYRVWPLQG